ncbi:DNA polymerase III subunit beta [Bartonella sp. HY329]|uniref:DNA polymerase III subunit beta n=1 Tax=unclassified Bartonella TaxID=2645622 RepID=UPI0021C7A1CA|nr:MULTISPECIES: DNA polymerase III subunit beta [unclassified Bartonella]UXM94287.1 DNA polymerase III subunit beta [Bartonella sp. HY329]UXN08610.1 DNA polymerase III subunit beta [Bartonella sp. HY328]
MTDSGFSISRSALLPALNAVVKAVERRNTLPILGHIVLEVDESRPKLTATNLDLQITVTTQCQNFGQHGSALPGILLHDAVRKLDVSAQIEFAFLEGSAEVRAGRAKFKLQSLNKADMPIMGIDDGATDFNISPQVLDSILNKVAFAVSTEETRYYLNGINLHMDGDKLVAAATDGHRLAQLKLAVFDGRDNFPASLSATSVIVPRTFWSIVKGLFVLDEDIKLQLSDVRIAMSQGDICVVSKLIDGTFPDYQRVIPQASTHFYHVPVASLSKALERVMAVLSTRGRGVTFIFGNGELKLGASDSEMGDATDSVDLLENSSAEEIAIGFNARYALDQLAACGCDALTFGLTSNSGPALITPMNETAGSKAKFVLMPMRI